MAEQDRAVDVRRAWTTEIVRQLAAAGFTRKGKDDPFTRSTGRSTDSVLISLRAAGAGESAVDLGVVWLSVLVDEVAALLATLPDVPHGHDATWSVSLDQLVPVEDRAARTVARPGFSCQAVADVDGCTQRLVSTVLRYGDAWWAQVVDLTELRRQLLTGYARRGLSFLRTLVVVAHLTGDQETVRRALDDLGQTLGRPGPRSDLDLQLEWVRQARERFAGAPPTTPTAPTAAGP